MRFIKINEPKLNPLNKWDESDEINKKAFDFTQTNWILILV